VRRCGMFDWLLKGWRKREADHNVDVNGMIDSSGGTDLAGEAVEPVVSQEDVDEYIVWKKLRRLFKGCAVPRRRFRDGRR